MTNLGPLTTTYAATSGTACQSIYLARDTQGFWLERGTFEGCYPDNFTPIDGYYYSPGICQEGYTYACTASVGGPGTTIATCCPSGFTCRLSRSEDDNAACVSTLISDSSYAGDIITYPNDTPAGTTTALIGAGETVYAIGVPVRRASTDAEWDIRPTNPGTPTTQTETSPTNRPNPTSSSGDIEGSTDGSTVQSGLSTGAKAAIGVGVALGVFLSLAAIAAIYHLRRRRGRTSAPPQSNILQDVAGTERKPNRRKSAYQELEETAVYELSACKEPTELTGHGRPAELTDQSRPAELTGHGRPAELTDQSKPAELK